jgi:hypothetical protein
VVIGDLIGSGEAQEHRIVGETPNLTARLRGLAEPNSNISLLKVPAGYPGNLFELEDLGATDLQGIAGPRLAWTALRPSAAEMALHPSGLTESVGREEELLYREIAHAIASPDVKKMEVSTTSRPAVPPDEVKAWIRPT